jgi:hypothetical protein
LELVDDLLLLLDGLSLFFDCFLHSLDALLQVVGEGLGAAMK